MKKSLIGALVGGIILFVWQFLSWTALNIHGSQMSHTDKQDEIMNFLAESGLEEGSYFLPNVPPGATAEEYTAYQTEQVGKPWATLKYNESMDANMGMNMFRGFLVDFLAVFFLCFIFGKMSNLNFNTVVTSTVLIGLIGYLTSSYLDSIWFEGNSIPELIDTVVQFGLCGAWLGFWLNRNSGE
jgi:hypothetical protein